MTVAEGNNSMCLLVLNRRGRNPDPLLIHLPMCPLTYRQCPPTREMLATGLDITHFPVGLKGMQCYTNTNNNTTA